MKWMKGKTYLIVATAVFMTLLTACGGNTANNGTANEPSAETPNSEATVSSPVQLMIPTMAAGTWPYVSTETLAPYFESVLPKGSQIQRAPTSTGDISGLYLLRAGQGDLYMVSDLPAHWVWEGAPYPNIDKPYQDFSKLLQIEPYAGLGMFVSKSLVEQHDLKNVDDLFTKNINVSMATWPAGSSAIVFVDLILKSYGYDGLEDFKSKGNTILQGSPQDQVKYVRDRQADVYFGMIVGHDYPMIEEMTSSVDMVLLSYSDEKLAEIKEAYGYREFRLPGDAYKGMTKDETLLGVGGYIAVTNDMNEDVAYQMTKVMYENWDEIRGKDPFFSITPLHFEKTVVPFHPGAEKFLKEAGAIQ